MKQKKAQGHTVLGPGSLLSHSPLVLPPTESSFCKKTFYAAHTS